MLSTAMTSILSWWFHFATGYKVCPISQNHSQLLVQVEWWNLLLQRLDRFSFLVPLQTLVIGINIHFCCNYFPHKRDVLNATAFSGLVHVSMFYLKWCCFDTVTVLWTSISREQFKKKKGFHVWRQKFYFIDLCLPSN